MSDFQVDLNAHRVAGRTTSSGSASVGVLHAHFVEEGAEWTEVAGGPDHPHRHAVSERDSYTGTSVPITKEEWAEVVAEHERWIERQQGWDGLT